MWCWEQKAFFETATSASAEPSLQSSSFSALTQYSTCKLGYSNKTRKENKKETNLKEEINVFLLVDDTLLYIRDNLRAGEIA